MKFSTSYSSGLEKQHGSARELSAKMSKEHGQLKNTVGNSSVPSQNGSTIQPCKEVREKIEINETTLHSMNKEERDRLYASLADLRAKLKNIDDQEAKMVSLSVSTNNLSRQDELSSMGASGHGQKMITRVLKPRSAKSMSLDKWIEVEHICLVY